jgi:prevent-host-death family protein
MLVGAFEAKTHLSELIETVCRGGEVVISRRGKPVVRMVPWTEEAKITRDVLLSEFAGIRSRVGSLVPVKEWIAEGRR